MEYNTCRLVNESKTEFTEVDKSKNEWKTTLKNWAHLWEMKKILAEEKL